MGLVLEAIQSPERDVPDYIDADHKKLTAKLVRIPLSGRRAVSGDDGAEPGHRILLKLIGIHHQLYRDPARQVHRCRAFCFQERDVHETLHRQPEIFLLVVQAVDRDEGQGHCVRTGRCAALTITRNAIDFNTFSPTGKVPMLDNDGVKVWESLAILEYLADLLPDRGFWPEDR